MKEEQTLVKIDGTPDKRHYATKSCKRNEKPMLSARMVEYAQCFITTGNIVGCALNVGIKYKKIDEWTNSPNVQLAVEQIRAKNINKDAGMDKQFLLSKLRGCIDNPATDESDKLTAIREVGKILGVVGDDVELPTNTEDMVREMITALGEYYDIPAEMVTNFLKNYKTLKIELRENG